jgi:DNA-binding CsgD family transcriptional regulator
MNILNIIASQMKAALATQIEAALICDLNTNQILLANKKACQNLGFTTSEICSSHLDIIFPKSFKPIQFDKNEKNSKEIRQFLKKTGDSFIALTKNKILSIKNKNYQIISFKSLSKLAELSESDKNPDKENIQFSEKLFTISQKITNVDEDMFYKNMVYGLADAFKVRWSMICLLSPGGKEAKILSLWDQINFQSELVYKLKGTPCEKVKQGKAPFFCEKNLTKYFPKDFLATQWGVESYLGIPIVSKTNEIMGHLAVMDDKLIKIEKRIECIAIMQYFSNRIAKEIVLNNFKITTQKKEISNNIIKLTSKNKTLTKRELQVLDHVLSGLTGNSIAKQLSVSLPTIKFHLKNIYNKLGINGKNGLLKTISNMT